MEIDLEYEFEQETNKCMLDVDGTYSGSYIEWLEINTKELLIQRFTSSIEHLKCGECDCKIKYPNIGCDTIKDCKLEY